MIRRSVVFVPESGSKTGMGHVYRLLSMAQMLETEYQVQFIVQDDETAELVGKNHYKCVVSPFEETALIKHFTPGTIAIADGYNFKNGFFSSLRAMEVQTVFLDDFAAELPPADLILNTADLRKLPRKQHFLSQYACGHQYILLRNAFLEAAGTRRHFRIPVKSIFVCLGATDPLGITIFLIRQLSELLPGTRFTVLSSSMNLHLKNLAVLPYVKILEDASAEEIVQTLRASDFAIVSASNIAQECVATGIPLACIQTADNQENLYASLTENELCFPLGNAREFPDLLRSLTLRLRDKPYWDEQLSRQNKWIDGNSARRIRKLINSLDLTVRNVQKTDSDLLLEWKNDRISLENSFHSTPVSREEHATWFENELNDKNAVLYLICAHGEPVSLVRFKQKDGKAVIGITVSPEHRGSRFAPRSLVIACGKYTVDHKVNIIEAYIKEGNEASIRSFEAAGFRFQSRQMVNSVPALLLTKTSEHN